ncbi:MAG: DegV family protein [Clostridia bacterium]|nr:DegV family protein [Clostridia bacterium]
MQNIILATDSACDVPKHFVTENDIAVMPYHISFGDEDYIDGVTITRDELYKKVEETGTMPKTAAIPPAVFSDFFASLLEKCDAVIYLSLGSKFSSACQNAAIAASEFENVHVVDTNSLSSGEGVVLLKAIALRKEGMDAASIAESLRAYSETVDASFVLDELTYIHKGGRCSGVAALGANLLGIKPCLAITDGSLGIEKKYRGKLKVVVSKYIEERLSEVEADPEVVFLTDAGVDPEVREAAYQKLCEMNIFEKIYKTDAGCVISSHCGRGTLGILFAKK